MASNDELVAKVTELNQELGWVVGNRLAQMQSEMDAVKSNYVSKEDISAIDVDEIRVSFAKALDCGFAGKPLEDVLNDTNDCAEESNDNGDSSDGGDSGGSTEDSDNESGDDNGDSGSDSDGNNEDGDGAVI